MIAKVVVDVALDKAFDYTIPPNLKSSVFVGSRVVVPFGKRSATGYVLSIEKESNYKKGLKPIASLQGKKPYISPKMLDLVRWMSDYYCSPIERCIRTVLPGAVRGKRAGFKQRLFVEKIPDSDSLQTKLQNVTPKQQAILDIVDKHNGGIFMRSLLKESGVTESPVRTLAQRELLKISKRDELRDPSIGHKILSTKPLKLMPEQTSALKKVIADIDSPKPSVLLLYGVTGSGKTEVYLQAMQHVLNLGKGAIILVPEISLTPQTVKRFRSRFGSKIAVLHSHLSDGERHDEWHRIRSGDASVVIGARSAVFAPVSDLGLIVVDEEHEPSYKQTESPRYNARDVAVMRGHIQNCAVILGSATPAMESWYNVQNGKYSIATLPHRADHRKMPAIRIIDMRITTEKTKRGSVFSEDLLDAIRLRLDRKEQIILFLNRRGFSTSLICPKCGYVAECAECSVSFTYHRHDECLRCHICGIEKSVPDKCPECGDPAFRFAGIGTQRVEAVTRKCFPHAIVKRMDSDTMTRKDAYYDALGDFRSGKTDILVGTQMIAKGLHFPNVTLVGVVFADTGLHMPDFRAGERTYQLLAQVAGRAGRGDVSGEVIVQTYTPHHVAIQAARRLDYEGLCDQEIEFRKELRYPPSAHLVCVTLKGKSEPEIEFCTQSLEKRMKKVVSSSVIVSPACPAPLAKAKGYFRYQIIIRSRSVKAMTIPLREVVRALKFPKTVKCSIDVDALSIM